AAVALGAKPRAFSIGFAGHGDYDESEAASAVARRLGVPHHVEQLDISFDRAVNGVANAYDAPFADPSAVAMIELARLARTQVTVALSGTGGDDLFAGYYRHRAHRLRAVVRRAPERLRRGARRAASAQGRARRGRIQLASSYVARLAEAGGESATDQYLALVANMTSPSGLNALRFS